VQQEILFEFRAGKMTKTGTRVTPDPRKGLVRLLKVGPSTQHVYKFFQHGLVIWVNDKEQSEMQSAQWTQKLCSTCKRSQEK
jgi:hypothetical protein